MCGRLVQKMTWAELFALLTGQVVPRVNPKPRFNVAPTMPLASVYRQEEEKRFTTMRWGLQPDWAKGLLINAQAETYAEKRRSFWGRFSRCVVPADGFYEWQKTDSGKQPMYIRRRDEQPLLFGGLYTMWQPEGQAAVECAVVMTTRPNALMESIHHRMPVILEPGAVDDWLDPERDRRDTSPLLEPCAPGILEAHPVSRRVNNVRNDDPGLIEPLEED